MLRNCFVQRQIILSPFIQTKILTTFSLQTILFINWGFYNLLQVAILKKVGFVFVAFFIFLLKDKHASQHSLPTLSRNYNSKYFAWHFTSVNSLKHPMLLQ